VSARLATTTIDDAGAWNVLIGDGGVLARASYVEQPGQPAYWRVEMDLPDETATWRVLGAIGDAYAALATQPADVPAPTRRGDSWAIGYPGREQVPA
jgi:hypothetical protein